LKVFVGLFVAACLCLSAAAIGFGSLLVWRTVAAANRRSDEYARLLEVGVPVTGHVVGCSTSAGAGIVVSSSSRYGTATHCYVDYSYENVKRNWEYRQDPRQFLYLAANTPVKLLVDPAKPSTEAYTVRDVRNHENTSWVSLRTLFGTAAVLFGFALIGVLLMTFLT
jgi:hypothetical protein